MPPGKSCAFGAIHPGPWWWLLRCFGPPSASDTPRRMSGWWSQCPWGRRRPLRRNHNGIGFLCRGASGRARCADGIEMAPLAAAGRIPGGNQDIGYRKKQTATVFSVGRDHWARRIQGGDVMNGAVGCVWLLFAIQPPWAVIVTWATGRRGRRPLRVCSGKAVYCSGCFLILAKGRGNCLGVGLTLSMTTRRCVTSVPGMV